MVNGDCVLLDYEESIEILFSMPPGAKLNYPNEVVDYIRSRDNKTVSWVSSAGMREVQFEMVTSSSPTLERQLNYFRKTGKPILLLIPDIYFASEIVIREADLTETIGTTQTYSISAYCYGVEGMAVLASSSLALGQLGTYADSDALSGFASRLYEVYYDTTYFEVAAGNYCMPAGNYIVLVRAKSTNTVTNDLNIGVQDTTAGEYFANGTSTPSTTGYTYHAKSGTSDSNNIGHSVSVYAHKDTATANDIYIDLIAFVQSSGLITV